MGFGKIKNSLQTFIKDPLKKNKKNSRSKTSERTKLGRSLDTIKNCRNIELYMKGYYFSLLFINKRGDFQKVLFEAAVKDKNFLHCLNKIKRKLVIKIIQSYSIYNAYINQLFLMAFIQTRSASSSLLSGQDTT